MDIIVYATRSNLGKAREDLEIKFKMIINNYEIIGETPLVEDINSKGNKKYWKMYAGKSNGIVVTFSESWQDVIDGESKHTYAAPSKVAGKNIGRSNETTPEAQALFDIQSKYNLKSNKAYSEYPDLMLCGLYSSKKKYIVYDPYAIAEVKLDGVARMYGNTTGAYSRGLKPFKSEKTQEHLFFDTGDNYILQGECLLPKGYSLEDTLSAIQSWKPNLSPLLEYRVYNLIVLDDPNIGYADRLDLIANILKNAPPKVVAHEYEKVYSEQEYDNYHNNLIDLGHEGSVIYNAKMPYRDGKHEHLLKRKEFESKEFLCVDVIEGTGSAEGCAILILAMPSGERFNCNPMGKADLRAEYFNNRVNIIGKMVTAKYAKNQTTNTGLPKFANVEAIRDYE